MSRPVARVVIIDQGKVALMERHRQGRHYFVFPGGGIEPGETPEAAARREALEETGLAIALERVIARINFQGNDQTFFLAHPIGGEMGTGCGPEFSEPFSEENGTYQPCWVELERLNDLPVLPQRLAALAQNHPRWPDEILTEE